MDQPFDQVKHSRRSVEDFVPSAFTDGSSPDVPTGPSQRGKTIFTAREICVVFFPMKDIYTILPFVFFPMKDIYTTTILPFIFFPVEDVYTTLPFVFFPMKDIYIQHYRSNPDTLESISYVQPITKDLAMFEDVRRLSSLIENFYDYPTMRERFDSLPPR